MAFCHFFGNLELFSHGPLMHIIPCHKNQFEPKWKQS